MTMTQDAIQEQRSRVVNLILEHMYRPDSLVAYLTVDNFEHPIIGPAMLKYAEMIQSNTQDNYNFTPIQSVIWELLTSSAEFVSDAAICDYVPQWEVGTNNGLVRKQISLIRSKVSDRYIIETKMNIGYRLVRKENA